jgi:hypothetical protein
VPLSEADELSDVEDNISGRDEVIGEGTGIDSCDIDDLTGCVGCGWAFFLVVGGCGASLRGLCEFLMRGTLDS